MGAGLPVTHDEVHKHGSTALPLGRLWLFPSTHGGFDAQDCTKRLLPRRRYPCGARPWDGPRVDPRAVGPEEVAR